MTLREAVARAERFRRAGVPASEMLRRWKVADRRLAVSAANRAEAMGERLRKLKL